MFSTRKKRRKVSICPNCDHILKPEDNFCPNCGQENHSLKIPLGHLIYEFIESIFHFDIKVWETLRVALLKPGLLTKNFNEGKRARYVPPARLYVFISVIFFFLLNYVSDKSFENSIDNWLLGDEAVVSGSFPSIDYSNKELIDGSIRNLGYWGIEVDSITKSSGDNLTHYVVKLATGNLDFSNKLQDEATRSYSSKLIDQGFKSLLSDSIYYEKVDTSYRVRMYYPPQLLKQDSLNGVKWMNSSSFINNCVNKLEGLPENPLVKSIIKSILILNLSTKYERVETFNERLSVVSQKILKYFSLSMFFLMPVVALILTLLNYRKTFYYENFIFSIFHHALAFIWFSILILVTQLYYRNWVIGVFFLTFAFYLFFAMKRHYGESWSKTLLKYLVLGFLYFLILSIIAGVILLAGLL